MLIINSATSPAYSILEDLNSLQVLIYSVWEIFRETTSSCWPPVIHLSVPTIPPKTTGNFHIKMSSVFIIPFVNFFCLIHCSGLSAYKETDMAHAKKCLQFKMIKKYTKGRVRDLQSKYEKLCIYS